MMHSGIAHGTPGLRALRMPLYFMLSGLFFKDYGSFAAFTEKKVNKILVPFLFFMLLGFVWQSLLGIFSGRAVGFSGLWEPFVRPEMSHTNTPVWFLISLFWANLIYCGLSVSVRRPGLRAAAVFALGAAGYGLSVFSVYLPLFLGSSLTALPFFFAGSLLRRLPLLYPGRHDRLGPLLGLATVALCVGCCACMGTPAIDFRTNLYLGSPLVIFPLSVSLVVGLLLVCKGIGWLLVVSYMGRYSIMVLGLHFLMFDCVGFLVRGFAGRPPSKAEMFMFASLLCWLLIPVCRAFLPRVTAQADWVRFPRRRSGR